MNSIRKFSVGDVFPKTLFAKKEGPNPNLLSVDWTDRQQSNFARSKSFDHSEQENGTDLAQTGKSRSKNSLNDEKESTSDKNKHHHKHHHHRHRKLSSEISLAMRNAINHELMDSSENEPAASNKPMNTNQVRHKGSCHCGNVKFEALAPSNPTVIQCNCSICTKKQCDHFIIPQSNFKLLSGHTSLTTYSFNTHQAKHIFCSTCGVQSFYIPRSNSDGYGINIHCLDSNTLMKPKIEKFDGKNWTSEMKKKSHISLFSKAN